MVLKRLIKKMFGFVRKVEEWSTEPKNPTIYTAPEREEEKTLVSVWDALQFRENTQAHHISNVTSFEEWTDMEEILRRVRELFGAEYKNLRSLYPYLKTLSDIGLMETSSAGGRRKWRKVVLLVPIPKESELQEIKAKNSKKEKGKN